MMFRQPKGSTLTPLKKGTIEAKNKGLCKYAYRPCYTFCLENYDYCLKHILEDKTAPYKPCPFLFTISGKKCGKPAYRPDRRETWFCAEHIRRANLLRQKASVKHKPPPTQEALLASLAHYARCSQPTSVKKEAKDEASTKEKSSAVNPFVELDAAQVNTSRCSQVLDYASESDSDVESAMLDNIWRAQDHESSDAESVDSQAEDPLKFAGVYTAEEVTVIIKDKMIRLQSLYIDQFRRLQHLLKERRRKYLHSLKKEKETLCSIHAQEKTSTKDQKLYRKLKALNHYHKYYGQEAILHKKSLERRTQLTDGIQARGSHKGKCVFTEGGVKCGAKTLPVTKYCRKHILEDTQQVLFRACGVTRGDHTCLEPTSNVFENATCVYHIIQPAQPHIALDMIGFKAQEETFDSEKLNAGMSLMDVDTAELLKTEEPAISLLNPEEHSTSKPSLLHTVQSSLDQGLVDFSDDIPLSGHSSAEDTISADEALPNSQTITEDINSDFISKDQPISSNKCVVQVSSENLTIEPGHENDIVLKRTELNKEDHPKEDTLEEIELVHMGGMDVVEEVLESEENSISGEKTVESEVKDNDVENALDLKEKEEAEKSLNPEREEVLQTSVDSESKSEVEENIASTAKIESKSGEENG